MKKMIMFFSILRFPSIYKRGGSLLVCSLLSFSLFSQNLANTIQSGFRDFEAAHLKEKIFVHTDKDLYVAGELVWMKVYVVNADDNKPLAISRLAYAELLDDKRVPVLQSKLSLDNGKGAASFFLPSSISSGVYTLRVYTNWMKNSGSEWFFHKTVTIINTLKRTEGLMASHPSYDIQFFPEGGALVRGLQSRVGIKVTNPGGWGEKAIGYIVRNNTDTITSFQTGPFGMGSFFYTPVSGSADKALVRLGDSTYIQNLPAVSENGYVLTVTNLNSTQLQVKVSSNIAGKNWVQVFIHNHNSAAGNEKLMLQNGTGYMILDKSNLGEGVSHITVFNDQLQPVCERLYFTRPYHLLDIAVNPDQEAYGIRKPVTLSVSTADETGKLLPADMSVAVYRVDSLTLPQEESISSYIWLTSELKGHVESPDYYLTATGRVAEEAADNLMLTQGWRKFKWTDVLHPVAPAITYIPEYMGPVIMAKVTDKQSGLPAPGVMTYLSIPGFRIQFFASRSDSNGIARFYTKNIYGSNEVVLQTEKRETHSFNAELINAFSTSTDDVLVQDLKLTDNMDKLLTDYNTIMQVQNYYHADNLKQYEFPDVDTVAFYGKPDNVYKLDDYTRFSTMEEVLREYVQEVLVRRQKENFRLIMSEGVDKNFMEDPFVFFNGVPVLDVDKIMQYDPLKIRKIDIVKSKYFLGPAQMNGLVNFTAFQPDPAMISGLGGVVQDFEGVQYDREFYSPVYNTEEAVSSRLPDFRTLLYWNPKVITDTDGKTELKFYSSDLKGKYLVLIQGMDENGKMGQKTILFNVK